MLKLVTGPQPIMMRSKKVSPVLGERKKAYGYPEASLEEGKYLDHILNMASMVTFYSFFFPPTNLFLLYTQLHIRTGYWSCLHFSNEAYWHIMNFKGVCPFGILTVGSQILC